MLYTDLNGKKCELSFQKNGFSMISRHVLIISKFNGKWVLTDHPERGLEFPGGKAETGESLVEAAVREIYEETGACADQLEWLAEYKVNAEKPFCKTVFLACISRMEEVPLRETNGAVLVDHLALDDRYSFLMRDAGMLEIIKKVNRIAKWQD
ncbi:MAG TPA: NUDIX domain-containing protein [Planococcus sp. (in: firmicutes)]|nr:NUDIX domain-containing protein [Planococcus sp. (in: firmicutes)]